MHDVTLTGVWNYLSLVCHHLLQGHLQFQLRLQIQVQFLFQLHLLFQYRHLFQLRLQIQVRLLCQLHHLTQVRLPLQELFQPHPQKCLLDQARLQLHLHKYKFKQSIFLLDHNYSVTFALLMLKMRLTPQLWSVPYLAAALAGFFLDFPTPANKIKKVEFFLSFLSCWPVALHAGSSSCLCFSYLFLVIWGDNHEKSQAMAVLAHLRWEIDFTQKPFKVLTCCHSLIFF